MPSAHAERRQRHDHAVGMDLTRQPEHKRARYIGRLFQDPMKGTAPDMSIVENLGLAYSRGKRMTLSRAHSEEGPPAVP